jgi:glycosyltransferase involved in cell wall biosynthesis
VKLTLITVCRNAASVIAETLESALAQDHGDLELVVIDGASTDGTVEILREFEQRVNGHAAGSLPGEPAEGGTVDVLEVPRVPPSRAESRDGPRMILISEPDKGIYDAMNKGLRAATGEVIGFLNAGDLLMGPRVLRQVVAEFERSNADAVYGDIIMVDEHDIHKVHRTWLSGGYRRENFRKGWMPPHVATFIRRKVYDHYGHFNTDLRIGADYEILLRFLYKHKISTVHLPELLVRFRLGGMSNGNLKQILQANREVRASWGLNGLKAPPLLVTRKLWSKVMQFFERSSVHPAG